MHDGKFWLGIWSLITVAVLGLSIAITLSIKHSENVVAEIVSYGHSPIAASCAIRDGLGDNPTCIALAAKE